MPAALTDKQATYLALVAQRKQCCVCPKSNLNVVRLSDCHQDEYGSIDIGPWTEWQGNLDAELMVVGQDWGGTENYQGQRGCDRDGDDTNTNLVVLLDSIGRGIEQPSEYQHRTRKLKHQHYFTNAMLCLRSGNSTKGKKGGEEPKAQCFRNCAREFLKPQIDLVRPRVIVALGGIAYRAILNEYGMKSEKTMKAAMERTAIDGPVLLDGMQLVPVYHCGARVTRSMRSVDRQKEDWKLVLTALAGRA